MIEKRVARRYGSALFAIASEQSKVNEWQEQLDWLTGVVQSDSQFQQLLIGKNLTAQAKKDMMNSLFGAKVDKQILNFLFLLIDKNREEYLEAISAAYSELVDEAEGIVSVKVFAAAPMATDEEAALTETLEEITKKKVRLAVNVDKSIIGGLKVQVADVVYDGSISHQLANLRETLAK